MTRLSKTISETRKSRGQARSEVIFPVAPTAVELPKGYAALLEDLKVRIRNERLRVVMTSNAAMVLLYWDIGQRILKRQENEGWGAKVIDRLSFDLGKAFPDMSGFSPRNLKYMRAFATAWPDHQIVQEALAQLSWYQNLALLEKLDTIEERLWYAQKTVDHGWSRNILVLQIENKVYRRMGKAMHNFSATLPPSDSDMAIQVFKDPYLFDFLGTAEPRREAELEQGLIDHIQKFLLELGQGFAFVGRQVQLELGGEDFRLDLLFYHLKLRCYVVIELKARKFEPGDTAQLNMYMHAVDELLRHPDDKPTVGLLLVREKNRLLVEYALAGYRKRMSVAGWETKLTRRLPKELKGSLPTIKEIEAELQSELKKDDCDPKNLQDKE